MLAINNKDRRIQYLPTALAFGCHCTATFSRQYYAYLHQVFSDPAQYSVCMLIIFIASYRINN